MARTDAVICGALVLLALSWPAPCADPATCWLAWDPTPNATRYEIAADGVVCATIRETCVRGRCSAPRPLLWPAPGRCAPMTGSVQLRTRACNAAGCGGWSDPVEWQRVPFRCWSVTGEVPCD